MSKDAIDINNIFGSIPESELPTSPDNSLAEVQQEKESTGETNGGILQVAFGLSRERIIELDDAIGKIWPEDDLVSTTITRALDEIAKTDAEKCTVSYIIGRRVGLDDMQRIIRQDPSRVMKMMLGMK